MNSNNSSGTRNNEDRPIIRRGAAASRQLQSAISDILSSGVSAAPEVWRRLRGLFDPADVPSVNTVRSLIEEISARDTSTEWTLAEANLDEIPVVLPAWTAALAQGHRLTMAEAEWVYRIRIAAPDMPIDDVWWLARERVQWPDEAEWMDPLIAFAPWRDPEHRERYFAAADQIYIPFDAIFVAMRGLGHNEPLGPETTSFLRSRGLEGEATIETSSKRGKQTIVKQWAPTLAAWSEQHRPFSVQRTPPVTDSLSLNPRQQRVSKSRRRKEARS
jgi:hypothetical protein